MKTCLFCYLIPVKTIPTKMKRQPKTGSATWQFAATTTPATTSPPSIFSTLSLEIGAGQGNRPFFSNSGSGDLLKMEEGNFEKKKWIKIDAIQSNWTVLLLP